jgi:hypothetical protein
VGWAPASGAITLGSGSFCMSFSNGAHVNGQAVAPACNSIAWSNGNSWQRVGPGALVRPHFWAEDAARAPNALTVNFTYAGAGPKNVPMGLRNIVTLSWMLFGPRLPLAVLRAGPPTSRAAVQDPAHRTAGRAGGGVRRRRGVRRQRRHHGHCVLVGAVAGPHRG